MRYVSIDIETLGLDPETCDTIEIGAIFDDLETPIEELPRFHGYIKKDVYSGQPYAMSMHSAILKRIAKEDENFHYYWPKQILPAFKKWLDAYSDKERVVVAGKNFGSFDLQFLKKLPNFSELKFYHRFIDPSMLYFDNSMVLPPSLEDCLRLAGIKKTVEHTALADALDVIRVIRHKFLDDYGSLSPNDDDFGLK